MAIEINNKNIDKLIGENISEVYARRGESGAWILVFKKEVEAMLKNKNFLGNWKMNGSKAKCDEWSSYINSNLNLTDDKNMVVFVPSCYLDYMRGKLDVSYSIGIQDVSSAASGAYSGQISAEMAKECGCSYALIGTAETRTYLGVTNAACKEKISRAYEAGLISVLCVGEPLEVREAGNYIDFLISQLEECLPDNANYIIADNKLAIAYEPLWSIGTGKTITSTQASEMCGIIVSKIADMCSNDLAVQCKVLFGGSVKPTNAMELMSQVNIDGFLAGGVSMQHANWETVCELDYGNNTHTVAPLPKRTLADCSWAEIAAISEAGNAESSFSLGEEKQVLFTDGNTHTVRIIGFNHDDLASGGKAGITFDFKDVVTTNKFEGYSSQALGGWNIATIRTEAMQNYLTWLPTDLQGVIKTVVKKTVGAETNTGYAPTEIINSNDKLFLLSLAELKASSAVPSARSGEGSQYEYWKNKSDSAKIKNDTVSGSYNNWWLRTVATGQDGKPYYVGNSGSTSTDYANSTRGISFAFCV